MKKLRELLAEREKLAKYDDLRVSVEKLKRVFYDNGEPYECKSYPYQALFDARNGKRTRVTFTMQPFMMQIFIDALNAEIKKLEEE